jgi:predicted nucleic acid-binding protein
VIVLDTNVISEGFRALPNEAVISWLKAQPPESLYLCTPVLAELRYGVEKLPSGRRQRDLVFRVDSVESFFRDRILVLDAAAAAEFGRLAALRQRKGRRIEPMDGLIAAIASAQRFALATRDIDDFIGLGIELINPFIGVVPIDKR